MERGWNSPEYLVRRCGMCHGMEYLWSGEKGGVAGM